MTKKPGPIARTSRANIIINAASRCISLQTTERRPSARVSEAFFILLTGLTAPSAYELLQLNGRMRHHCTRVRGRMQTPTERATAGGERGHTPGAHPVSRPPSIVITRELVMSSRSNASRQRVQCGGSVRPIAIDSPRRVRIRTGETRTRISTGTDAMRRRRART
jgi:hypothetical protein